MKILTVDVEDWFHILDHSSTATEAEWASFPSRLESGLERILDAFDRHGQKGTFFILGWVARKHPDAVAEIARRGHEIATHSDMHSLVYTQTPEIFEDDLQRSLDAIEAAANIRPTAYRAPGFSITEASTWAFQILARNGITTDCSVFPAIRSHGGLPNFPHGGPCLLETIDGNKLRSFPISFGSAFGKRFIFSGGGYFRIAPTILLKQWFRQSDYVMTYFHPRDFDPLQPIIPNLPRVRRLKSYIGLRGALVKLETIMEATQFITLGEAQLLVDWSEVPIVKV